jgi:hypothetical protein
VVPSARLGLSILVFGILSAGCGDDEPAPEPEPPPPARACAFGARYGGPGEQEALAIATDPSGNIFIAGRFTGTLDFVGSPLMSASADPELFVAKLDSGGRHLWSKSGGPSATTVAIDTDADGNLLLAGSFTTQLNLGLPLGAVAGTNVFIAKLDPEGMHIWSRRFGDSGEITANAMAVDGGGSLLVTGEFDGVVNFGLGARASQVEHDVFLVKFDPGGTEAWDETYGRVGEQAGTSIAIDGGDNILLTGYFKEAIDLGGGDLTATQTSVFLGKLDAEGGHVWSTAIGPLDREDPHLVAVDASDAVYLSGPFNHGLEFEGGSIVGAGESRVYLAKFDAAGTYAWSGNAAGPLALGLAIDSNDHAAVAVRGIVHEFDPGGAALTDVIFGTPSSMGGTAKVGIPNELAADDEGHVFLAGSVIGDVLCGDETIESAAGTDAFVAKLGGTAPPASMDDD